MIGSNGPHLWGRSDLPLGDRILLYIEAHPDFDDVEIAQGLGEDPAVVSGALRTLHAAGLISCAPPENGGAS